MGNRVTIIVFAAVVAAGAVTAGVILNNKANSANEKNVEQDGTLDQYGKTLVDHENRLAGLETRPGADPADILAMIQDDPRYRGPRGPQGPKGDPGLPGRDGVCQTSDPNVPCYTPPPVREAPYCPPRKDGMRCKVECVLDEARQKCDLTCICKKIVRAKPKPKPEPVRPVMEVRVVNDDRYYYHEPVYRGADTPPEQVQPGYSGSYPQPPPQPQGYGQALPPSAYAPAQPQGYAQAPPAQQPPAYYDQVL